MVENQAVDEFILSSVPATFGSLHRRAETHFGVSEMDRKVDGRLQSLRKRGLIKFDRIKGEGIVWSKAK